jgi:hypothetical protein
MQSGSELALLASKEVMQRWRARATAVEHPPLEHKIKLVLVCARDGARAQDRGSSS